MAITIPCLTIWEFQEHFNRLPINYKSKIGIEYTTFITTLPIFNQVIKSLKLKAKDRALTCKDNSGNKCKLIIRKFYDPDNEFKMIALIFNTTTGERIALITE